VIFGLRFAKIFTDMKIVEVIGIIAGMLTTFSFIPQVIKTWKDRSAEDLSLVMFLMFVLGVALWLAYGFILQNFVLIFFNAITFLLASFILYFKIRFK